ncbi:hypothetical protein D3C75_619710 [compost metagenome]
MGIGIFGHPDNAIRPFVVDRIGVIKRSAVGAVIAVHRANVAFFDKLRSLRGFHHQAARNSLSVKRRRRPFDNINAFEEPRVNLNHVVAAGVAHQAQAIKENVIHITAVETAQGNGVITCCATRKAGEHARRVIQCAVNR